MLSATAVVVCALELLGRSPASTAPIRFLNTPPQGVSRNAEAFVVRNPNTIYLITSSAVFRDAMRADSKYENIDVFRKIASIIVHEEWHLKEGPDEQGAYYAQLTMLSALGARPELITTVRKSMFAAVAEQKRRRPELLMVAK
jgi:hypothetical protein